MRIHQLAKELDLKAKDLFPHLKKLGIEFKNHMSAISEDDVARVKHLINPPTAENVVEHRIQPTIIRRRRKAESSVIFPHTSILPAPAVSRSISKLRRRRTLRVSRLSFIKTGGASPRPRSPRGFSWTNVGNWPHLPGQILTTPRGAR